MIEKNDYSSHLMDKLAGELSENDAKEFEQLLSEDESLDEEFSFFESAWADMDQLTVSNPPDSVQNKFYEQLAEVQKREERSLKARFLNFIAALKTASPLSQNVAIGSFLLAVGFILGGQFNTKNIQVTQTINPTAELADYILGPQKIEAVKTIPSNANEKDAINKLKEVVQKQDEHTNVRLTALNQLANFTGTNQSLKRFFAKQLEQEQSPLVQIELLNLIIESSRTKESIQTMENLLAKKSLNPYVQDKIHKDLPVLRASFVK